MKLIKAEYTGKTSRGFYCSITFEKRRIFRKRKIVTKEAFLSVSNFENKHYSPFPIWVDTGASVEGVDFYRAVREEMIRQFEL